MAKIEKVFEKYLSRPMEDGDNAFLIMQPGKGEGIVSQRGKAAGLTRLLISHTWHHCMTIAEHTGFNLAEATEAVIRDVATGVRLLLKDKVEES